MSAEDELVGRVIVITGAASGIGRATAARLHAAGVQVVALDRSPIDLPVPQAHVMDVTSEDDWRTVVAAALAQFGRIDGLVNCAGIATMGAITQMAHADFRRVMAVNVEGPFLGMKHVLPTMLAAGTGSVVNISSTAGIAGAPGAAAYCASKGAIRMMSKSAGLEAIAAGGAVRVNSLHPAMTETPMVAEIVRQVGGGEDTIAQMRQLQPAGHFLPADAIVDGIVFLLSDRSRYMNAAELVVDNGFTAQ